MSWSSSYSYSYRSRDRSMKGKFKEPFSRYMGRFSETARGFEQTRRSGKRTEPFAGLAKTARKRLQVEISRAGGMKNWKAGQAA